jgi:MoaA/NifB/PqqE/SkfB family radical SAM enzyme
MRFPLALTAKIARHIIKHKLLRTPRFALVLQLEPLHTCNLTCTGCGRIREYSTSLKDMMSLEDCLGAAQECGAPMVSICGGEPLIYPKIEELVAGLLAQRRIVYICTNGMFMRKKLKDYLAATYTAALEPMLARLLSEKLVSDKDIEGIRKGKHDGRPVIRPTKWLYWNVHVDGLEYTHDLIVEREGVFKECVEATRMAKLLGFQVATNTTVYKETDPKEIEQMFEFFSSLEVDAHTISPGYEYDAAKKDMVKRLNKKPENFFLTRAMTRQKFAKVLEWGQRFTFIHTAVYQEFLAGKRDLTCTAWAIPTRNIKGWKAPCYLMTDGHYERYQEMLDRVDWNKYGVVGGVARDPRCENCMVHCGYDPSGALSPSLADTWKNMRYNFSARPAPYYEGRKVNVFNGVSSGKGHLAEAKAALRSGMAGSKSAFQNQGGDESHASSCSTGDTSERDDLLAKVRATKKS